MTIEAVESRWFGLRKKVTELPVGTSIHFGIRSIARGFYINVKSSNAIEVVCNSHLTWTLLYNQVLIKEEINKENLIIPEGNVRWPRGDVGSRAQIRWRP